MTHVTFEEERIRLDFDYDMELVDKVKRIPGRRYDPEERFWTIPQAQWVRFREVFSGLDLELHGDGWWEKVQWLESRFFPPIADVEGFHGELYPFQTEAVGFLVGRRRCLLADEMGLGKTICSIAAALELRNRGKISRILFFCPKTIIRQWVGEIERFTDEESVAVSGTKAQRKQLYRKARGAFWVVTNYETVLREAEQLADLKPDLVALDEAQRIGTYDAKTTRLMKEHFRPPYRWALTGTPLENALTEIHSIFDWIDPGILGPWFIFKRNYLIYGGYKNKQVIGHRKLQDLRAQISRWMMRRRKNQVLKDLPPVTVNNYYVQLNPTERKIYRQIHRKLGDFYETFRKIKGKFGSGDVLAQLMYLRECCDGLALLKKSTTFPIPITTSTQPGSKLKELTALLKDLGDEKVVIFSEFARMLPIIGSELRAKRIEYEKLEGSMKQQERVRALVHFQRDPDCKVFLCTEAGGLGVNLQSASCVINYDCHWNPARLQQRVARLHRIGQPNTVTCINLIAENTIEERVLKVITEKTRLFRKVVDDAYYGADHEAYIWRILAEEFPRRQLYVEA